jgi:hypothetical protein
MTDEHQGDLGAAMAWAGEFIQRMAPYRAGCIMVGSDQLVQYNNAVVVDPDAPIPMTVLTSRSFAFPGPYARWEWPAVPPVKTVVRTCVAQLDACRQHDKVYVRSWWEPVIEEMMSGKIRMRVEARLAVKSAPPA